jgi:hypothetical protein
VAGATADPTEATETRAAPFRALIAGWSLIIVVLSVAGYSFRWTYYYNFGLQSLVLAAPLASLPVYSIEILRSWESLIDLIRLAIVYLVPLQVALLALKRGRDSGYASVRTGTRLILRLLAIDNSFVVQAIVAALIIFIAFRVGGEAGYRNYRNNVVEKTSRLPRVTAIAPAGSAVLSIPCDKRLLKERESSVPPPFVGDSDVPAQLGAGKACSSDERSWRLLLRDDKFIYLFATVPDAAQRPETLVLPNNDNITLVFR